MWILVLLKMIMWCKYMTCLRIFSVQSYCLNSLFYVNKCQCCNKCSLMMICDKFKINRIQHAGVKSENEKCSSLKNQCCHVGWRHMIRYIRTDILFLNWSPLYIDTFHEANHLTSVRSWKSTTCSLNLNKKKQ